MLIDIGAKEFYKYFPHSYHPFLLKDFIELNKHKSDRLVWLADTSNNPSIGLIAGDINGFLFSPFSAPFGGFHVSSEFITISQICNFIESLKEYISVNRLKGIKIILPPDIYAPVMNAKLINCLKNNGFAIETMDITSWVNLDNFQDRFSHSKARQYLNQAVKNGLQFKLVNEKKDKQSTYTIIKENRESLQRPIYMSFEDIEKVNTIWEVDYFLTRDGAGNDLASAIIYRAHPQIAYAVFWGDNEKGRSLRAMNFTVFNLWMYYKKLGYKLIDIGISTENGIPNEGLIWFKESHDAESSLRYSFKWIPSTYIESKENNAMMNPITKYGITLRLVDVEDAEFILKLRNDRGLNQFISYTSPHLDDQIKWIQEYKIREKKGLECYFVALDSDGTRYGTIRLYNLDEKSFEIGSWLFQKNAPIGMAVKAHFIGFEIGFEMLKAEYSRFEIRKKNTGVLNYMKDFETNLIREDELNFYYTLSKEKFYKRRSELAFFESTQNLRYEQPFIHPTAEVQTSNIGAGTSVWQYCVVLKGAVIGQNCNLNYNVFVENDVIIGNNVTVKSGVQLWDGLRIEDNAFISPNVAFTNDFAPRSKVYPNKFLTTTVKEGASIGANSTIIGGITIGKYAMIGAGSLVTKSVPDYNLWYGHPASFKAYICKCGQKLNEELVCKNCNKRYQLNNGIISEEE